MLDVNPKFWGESVPIASCQLSTFPLGGIGGQESWRHAGPDGENDERKQIAERHCPSPRFVQSRASRRPFRLPKILATLTFIYPIPRICVVEKPNQESDRAGNMDKGVGSIDPSHYELILHEESLNIQLPEYA